MCKWDYIGRGGVAIVISQWLSYKKKLYAAGESHECFTPALSQIISMKIAC